jgi:hypothetical protein
VVPQNAVACFGYRRLAVKGGDPVVELQTNFGGGKTHSMLALYHLFSGTPASDLPGIEELVKDAGVPVTAAVKRAVDREKDKSDSVVLFFRDKGIDPMLAGELAEVRKTLGLDPTRTDFRVVFGAVAANANEIAIVTRSVIRILSELSTFVEVPVEHQVSGIAPPFGEEPTDGPPQLRVLSGVQRPATRSPRSATKAAGSGSRKATSGRSGPWATSSSVWRWPTQGRKKTSRSSPSRRTDGTPFLGGVRAWWRSSSFAGLSLPPMDRRPRRPFADPSTDIGVRRKQTGRAR